MKSLRATLVFFSFLPLHPLSPPPAGGSAGVHAAPWCRLFRPVSCVFLQLFSGCCLGMYACKRTCLRTDVPTSTPLPPRSLLPRPWAHLLHSSAVLAPRGEAARCAGVSAPGERLMRHSGLSPPALPHRRGSARQAVLARVCSQQPHQHPLPEQAPSLSKPLGHVCPTPVSLEMGPALCGFGLQRIPSVRFPGLPCPAVRGETSSAGLLRPSSPTRPRSPGVFRKVSAWWRGLLLLLPPPEWDVGVAGTPFSPPLLSESGPVCRECLQGSSAVPLVCVVTRKVIFLPVLQ